MVWAALDFGFGQGIELWRSEEMQLVQLMMPAESAHVTIGELGDTGLLQFWDLNSHKSASERTHAGQVKRLDEMARIIRFLREQVLKAGLSVGSRDLPAQPCDIDELEPKLQELESLISELSSNSAGLARREAELREMALVLDNAGGRFQQARAQAQGRRVSDGGAAEGAAGPAAPLLEAAVPAADHSPLGALCHVAGLVPLSKLDAFERMLFRATRGNVLLHRFEVGRVVDPASGFDVEKAVFLAFFSGERARQKVTKICDSFGATRYPLPDEPPRQAQTMQEVAARLQELHHTCEVGGRQSRGVLEQLAFSIRAWDRQVCREKAICHTLNKLSLDASKKVIVAEAWMPAASRRDVLEALQRADQKSNAQMPMVMQPVATSDPPPTYYRTTPFTSSFQGIVEAYGLARYREVNPAVCTIATFPFLFAVMFGDFGHALLMLLFAALMVVNEKRLGKTQLDEMAGMAFGGRYVILLMAVFSVFTGILYNEFFSIPMTIFGRSPARCMVGGQPLPGVEDMRTCNGLGGVVAFPRGAAPYPFGVDPSWHGTQSELPFLNSMKMKMSILLGGVHMNLGIMMSLFNHLYFGDTLSIVCEFVPQMIFLNALFGYLSSIILFKWITGTTTDLYHVMIYMFLSPGKVDEAGYMFPGQGSLQLALLFAAFLAVPWMLLPKPFVLRSRHRAALSERPRVELGAGHHSLTEDEERGLMASHARKAAAAATAELLEADAAGGDSIGVGVVTGAALEPSGGGTGPAADLGAAAAAAAAAAVVSPPADVEAGAATCAQQPGVPAGGAAPIQGGLLHRRSSRGQEHFDFGEVMVHQMIHTIEFVLGAVSNTASYLRLWALSLAHSQLSAVFYDKVVMLTTRMQSVPAMMVGVFMFFWVTVGVLMVMESLSAFLHALRLHWVEFMNKFYKGDGYAFTPLSFAPKEGDL